MAMYIPKQFDSIIEKAINKYSANPKEDTNEKYKCLREM